MGHSLFRILSVMAVMAAAWTSSVAGDENTITITLDGGDSAALTVPVKKPGESVQLCPPGAPASSPPSTSPAQVPSTQQPEAPKVGQIGVVASPYANIYRDRSRSGRVFSAAKKGTPVAIVSSHPKWYGVLMANGWTGWLESKHIKLTNYLLVASQNPKSYAHATSIISTANGYMGVPYIMGGTNPSRGMDCSAFVQQVFARNGISLPRTARTQARVGSPVPLDQIRPGDRLYFSCKNSYIDHCGIYIGGGQFIHCSASHGGVAIDSLAKNYYWQNLITVRRS